MGIVIAIILVGLGVLGLLLIMFIPSKNDMPPLEYSIKKSKVVWGLWFTGGTHGKDLIESGKVKKILILDPTSLAFEANLTQTSGYKINAKKEIDRFIELFKELAKSNSEMELRLYNKYQSYSLTFYDYQNTNEPLSECAYCIYQKDKEGMVSSDRKRNIIENKGNGKIDYKNQIDNFIDLWKNNSISLEDYFTKRRNNKL